MFSSNKAAQVAAISATLAASLVSAVTINTPSALIQCQPTLLTWGDGVAPFYISIIPGGQPSAAALLNLPTQSGTQYTWIVNLNPGQDVTVRITDSTGATNYAQQVPVQAGSSTSCMNGAASGNAAPVASSSAAGGNAAAASTALRTTQTQMFTPVVTSSSGPSVIGAKTTVTSGINNNAGSPSSSAVTSKPNSAMGSVSAKSALATLGLAAVASMMFALVA